MSGESAVDGQQKTVENSPELLIRLERAVEASERWKQERYELQTQLRCAQAVIKEAEEAVEQLQATLKEKDNEASKQINQVKNRHNLEMQQWRQKVENLEEVIENIKKEHQKEVTHLKEKLSLLERDTKDDSKPLLEAELEALKNENEALRESAAKLQEQVEQLMQENINRQKLYTDIVQSNDELKCSLQIKKEELESTLQCLSELREEMALLRQANITPPSTDAKKGNSLFAEVEDNRQALKNSLDSMILKYKRLKKLFQSKCAEVSHVMGEKAALCRQLENAHGEEQNYSSELANSYLVRIKDLENTVHILKSAGKDKPVKMISNDYEGLKLVESMLEEKSKEIETLREQLEERSVNHMLQSEHLHKIQRELQVARTRALKAESELVSLKNEVKKDTLSPVENLSFGGENLGPNTSTGKENLPLKSVRFSDNENKPIRLVKVKELSCPVVDKPFR